MAFYFFIFWEASRKRAVDFVPQGSFLFSCFGKGYLINPSEKAYVELLIY